jgi:heat shock protein HslJ
MKTTLTFAAMLLLLAGSFSCGKEEENKITSLDGITWKLVGFVDAQGNTVKPHNCSTCFLVTFHKDGTFSGYTSANDIWGTYEIDINLQKLTISSFAMTEVAEHPDGSLFIECMNNVTSYKLLNEQLSLYYSSTNYLLFNPVLP